MVMYLREPFFLNVLEGRWGGYAETDQEDICLGV